MKLSEHIKNNSDKIEKKQIMYEKTKSKNPDFYDDFYDMIKKENKASDKKINSSNKKNLTLKDSSDIKSARISPRDYDENRNETETPTISLQNSQAQLFQPQTTQNKLKSKFALRKEKTMSGPLESTYEKSKNTLNKYQVSSSETNLLKKGYDLEKRQKNFELLDKLSKNHVQNKTINYEINNRNSNNNKIIQNDQISLSKNPRKLKRECNVEIKIPQCEVLTTGNNNSSSKNFNSIKKHKGCCLIY